MSFNRTKYDSDAFKQDTNRSIAPGDYRLFESYPENINQCFSDFGPIGAKSDVSLVKPLYDLTFGDMAMTESNLSWRSHRLSKDTNSKKVEICNSAIDNNNLQSKLSCPKIHHKNDCSKKLIPEDTRFTFPLDYYRSMSLTYYQIQPYLSINPQCTIQEIYDKIGLNSRLYSKDMYVMHEQTPWDDGSVFPKEVKNSKPYTCSYV